MKAKISVLEWKIFPPGSLFDRAIYNDYTSDPYYVILLFTQKDVQIRIIQIKEDVEKGEHRLIGAILIQMGVMNTSQVNDVLDAL